MLYKLMGSQDLLMGPSGVRWGQEGEVVSGRVKWGQVRSKGTKRGQVSLSRINWGQVGNVMRVLVSGWVNGWVIGWVSERFGER